MSAALTIGEMAIPASSVTLITAVPAPSLTVMPLPLAAAT